MPLVVPGDIWINLSSFQRASELVNSSACGDCWISLRSTYFTLYDLRADVGANDVRLAHVSHPEQKTKLPITQADHRVTTEQKGLGAFLRAR